MGLVSLQVLISSTNGTRNDCCRWQSSLIRLLTCLMKSISILLPTSLKNVMSPNYSSGHHLLMKSTSGVWDSSRQSWTSRARRGLKREKDLVFREGISTSIKWLLKTPRESSENLLRCHPIAKVLAQHQLPRLTTTFWRTSLSVNSLLEIFLIRRPLWF
jgi:hypothetical protein